MNLTNRIQAQEFRNKQLNERLEQREGPSTVEVGQGYSRSSFYRLFSRLRIMNNLLMMSKTLQR